MNLTVIMLAGWILMLVVAGMLFVGLSLSRRRRINEAEIVRRGYLAHQQGLEKTNEGLRILYRELEKRNGELRKLDEMKSEFVSTVSHELRTPLTIIREGVSLVHEGASGQMDDEHNEILTDVMGNVDRLEKIINDLLDISKLEAGRIMLRKMRIPAVEVIRKVAANFQTKASRSGLTLSVHLPERLSPIYADRNRLIQVLTNLIANAIKFTPAEGKIIIQAKETRDFVEISVVDTGRGIQKADFAKLFEKFRQFGRNHGPYEQGTGLGLAISKRIVELHGGKIWAESTPGVGSIFHFSLPKYKSYDLMTARLVQEHIDIARRRDSKEHLSIILINVMNMGQIKSSVGEEGCDEAFRQMIKAIDQTIHRSNDTVSRAKSHQIVVVLPETDRDGALAVRKRIGRALKTSGILYDGSRIRLDVSFSIAMYPGEGTTAEELFQYAESEMKEANA